MVQAFLSNLVALLAIIALSLPLHGQTALRQAPPVDKAAAYYHFALGHLYAELAAAYGGRGEYLNKAIENYRLALKSDPDAAFLAEELSDLYIQAGRIREAVQEAEESLRQNPKDLTARRLLGRIYMRMIGDSQQNKIDERMLSRAIDQYQKIAELQPEDIETWLTLGRLYKVAQNSVEAEKAYKKVLALEADNEEALLGLAMVYADVGNVREAAALLKQAAGKSPSLRTFTALASAYEQMRDYGQAAAALRKALELSPGNPEIKRQLAQDLLLNDQLDEALKLYQELAGENPKDAQSWLRMSQIYRQKRDFNRAREAAEKAKAVDPESLELRFNDVNLLEAEGKTQQAIAALEELLASTAKRSYSGGERANRILLLERLGVLLRAAEKPEKAIEAFRRMAELDETLGARVAAQIIETWRAAKNTNKALEEAEAAIKKYPQDRMVRLVRATVLAESGRADEGAEDLKKLLDGKDDREVWVALAQVYEKAKNFSEQSKALEAAEKLSDSKEEREAIYFMRGAMYEKMKRYEEAEQQFRRVLEMNPKNASALNYLGYMLADRGVRLEEAHQLISKALELDPDNAAYLDSLGWVYYRMGKLDEAERYLLRAIERYARDAVVHDHLGDVYAQQGRLKDAIAQWQISLREWNTAPPADQDPAEIAKVQRKLESAKVRLAKESSQSLNNNQ
jgi:tetratricopeptide (TPR) repeat protein